MGFMGVKASKLNCNLASVSLSRENSDTLGRSPAPGKIASPGRSALEEFHTVPGSKSKYVCTAILRP